MIETEELLGLWRALGQSPEDWRLVGVIADYYEENGYADAGEFFRWVGKNKYFPFHQKSYRSDNFSWDWRDLGRRTVGNLPRRLWTMLKGHDGCGLTFKEYDTLAGAFTALFLVWKEDRL